MSTTTKQRSGELWVLMQTRRLGLGRNPLRRHTDRIESALLWCTLVAALLLIPVAAAFGTSVGKSVEASAAHQRAVLHEVQATALEDTANHVPTAPGDVLSVVGVRYVDQRGVEREAMTSVVIGTKTGDQVTVWLDDAGKIVTAPRTTSDSSMLGGTVGTVALMAAWLLLWGLFRLARVPLDRRRSHDWDTEWKAIAPRWPRGQQ